MVPMIDHLEVAAHDQRGLGRTSVPIEQPTMADYAADAIALLDHLGWDRCRVIGISFGGMVADRARAPKTDEQRRGEALQLAARAGHDVVDRLGAITCPTLVAAGRYDGIAPLANSNAIVTRVPSATLQVYEGGHAFLAQDHAAVPDIVNFLA